MAEQLLSPVELEKLALNEYPVWATAVARMEVESLNTSKDQKKSLEATNPLMFYKMVKILSQHIGVLSARGS